MSRLGSDTISTYATGAELGTDRAAQIARENQLGAKSNYGSADNALANPWRLYSLPSVGFEGLKLSDLRSSKPPVADQISDCSKEKCIVDGKQYRNSTDIPGNAPKPLLHKDGTPVLGPDKQPIVGPESVDIEQIASDARAHKTWRTLPAALLKFRHCGEWDFQRRMTDEIPGTGSRPIFTKQYQNFSNIAIGYILGSIGASLQDIGRYADKYCWAKGCDYKEPRAKDYPNIAERQYEDYEIGIRLWKERHLQVADAGK